MTIESHEFDDDNDDKDPDNLGLGLLYAFLITALSGTIVMIVIGLLFGGRLP